jgi:hypothetical protein
MDVDGNERAAEKKKILGGRVKILFSPQRS